MVRLAAGGRIRIRVFSQDFVGKRERPVGIRAHHYFQENTVSSFEAGEGRIVPNELLKLCRLFRGILFLQYEGTLSTNQTKAATAIPKDCGLMRILDSADWKINGEGSMGDGERSSQPGVQGAIESCRAGWK